MHKHSLLPVLVPRSLRIASGAGAENGGRTSLQCKQGSSANRTFYTLNAELTGNACMPGGAGPGLALHFRGSGEIKAGERERLRPSGHGSPRTLPGAEAGPARPREEEAASKDPHLPPPCRGPSQEPSGAAAQGYN